MNSNIISFVAHYAEIDIHYHHCFQVAVSIHHTFDCIIEEEKYTNLKGFVINQRYKHSCQAKNSSVIILLIDAESNMGRDLKKLLKEKPFLKIEDILTSAQLDWLQVKESERFDSEIIYEKYENLLDMLFPSQPKTSVLDSRIEEAIKYVDINIDRKIELSEIANLIHLSSDRTRHLFVEQIGIPFSQYILWKRIKEVIFEVLKKETPFTDAAIKCGFSDDAHFARTYRRMFGISAKPMLKNSRYVQFLSPTLI